MRRKRVDAVSRVPASSSYPERGRGSSSQMKFETQAVWGQIRVTPRPEQFQLSPEKLLMLWC